MGNKQEKLVVILSYIELVNTSNPGAARVMNYARAISKNAKVIIFSFQRPHFNIVEKEIEHNIYTKGLRSSYNKYVKKVLYPVLVFKFVISIKNITNVPNTTYLLYPSTNTLLDYFVVFFLIFFAHKKVYYEANEVRKYTAYLDSENSSFISMFRRKVIFYKYSMSERLTKHFTGLLCISTNIQTYFEKWNSNTLRIPILSNNNEMKLRKRDYSTKKPFKICLAGSISIAKENLLEFVDAVSKVVNAGHDIELNLYGPVSGHDLDRLKEYASSKACNNLINYHGVIDHKDLNIALQEQDLLVLPRGDNLQNHYGFSTKLSEYLITGVPCLITDVSDNTLYVKDGVNGFVVPPNDVEAMAEKIRYVILNYSSKASVIAENALDTVNKELSYKVYSEKINSFLFESY